MKKIIMFVSIILLAINLAGETVKNPDKPLKGEWDFKLEKAWEVDGAGEEVLVSGSAIKVDDRGRVYFLDARSSKVFIFDEKGKFLFSFGRKGEGPGELKFPMNLFIWKDKVIIPDMSKIHYFSTSGKYIKSKNPGKFLLVMGIIDGNRLVFSEEITEEGGKPREYLKLYNVETGKARSIVDVPAPMKLSAQSGGMALSLKVQDLAFTIKNDVLYYGKGDRYLLKTCDLQGKELLSFSIDGRKRKPISPAFQRKKFENVIVNGQKMPRKMVDQMVQGLPKESLYFKSLYVDDRGLVYVTIADEENETGREMDIFSPRGEYLYHGEFKLPNNLKIAGALSIDKGFLYVFAEDEEGERQLIKYKISLPEL